MLKKCSGQCKTSWKWCPRKRRIKMT